MQGSGTASRGAMAYHLDVLRHLHAGPAPGRVEVHDERHLPLPPHQLLQLLGRHLLLQPRAKENQSSPEEPGAASATFSTRRCRAAYHEVVRRDVLAGARHVGRHRLRGVPANGWRAAVAGANEGAAAGAVPARGGGRNGEGVAPREQSRGCSGNGAGGGGRQEQRGGCGHGGNDGEARRGKKSYPVSSVRATGAGGLAVAKRLGLELDRFQLEK